MESVVPYFANSGVALFIALDVRYDGPFQARRSVEGLSSITLKLLEFGYWDYFSDHHDEPAERTIVAIMHFVIPKLVRLPHLHSTASL